MVIRDGCEVHEVYLYITCSRFSIRNFNHLPVLLIVCALTPITNHMPVGKSSIFSLLFTSYSHELRRNKIAARWTGREKIESLTFHNSRRVIDGTKEFFENIFRHIGLMMFDVALHIHGIHITSPSSHKYAKLDSDRASERWMERGRANGNGKNVMRPMSSEYCITSTSSFHLYGTLIAAVFFSHATMNDGIFLAFISLSLSLARGIFFQSGRHRCRSSPSHLDEDVVTWQFYFVRIASNDELLLYSNTVFLCHFMCTKYQKAIVYECVVFLLLFFLPFVLSSRFNIKTQLRLCVCVEWQRFINNNGKRNVTTHDF